MFSQLLIAKTKKGEASSEYKKRLCMLRLQLETATWEKCPNEEELEDIRLDALFAHGRYLRRTANCVKNFFNNIFCKSDIWKQEFHSIGVINNENLKESE